jgi:RimJ/RimL family protein N-acetyltransferase
VIGAQSVHGRQFPVTREISTGSWIGRRHQGQGIGSEMRAAVLMFAFDHLNARRARSTAWEGNAASRGVSRKLGYVEDGTEVMVPRCEPMTRVRLLLERDRFVRPDWELEVEGLDACRALLGARG